MHQLQVLRLPLRQRIVTAASELFFHEGIRRVTVDAIASRAATTKMAVYRHFESKDALVRQWLQAVTAEYAAVLDKLEADHADDALEQLQGFVTFVVESLDTTSYRGCPFINCLAELPEDADPARRIIEAHKARQALRITALCRKAQLTDPEGTAATLLFLLEGAQVSAQNRSFKNIGSYLATAVNALIAERRQEPSPLPKKIETGSLLRQPQSREPSVRLELQRIIHFTDDIDAMAHFYRDVIGLEPVSGGDKQWQEFQAGGCNIALHKGKPNPGTRGPKIVFHSLDVAATRATLVKRGAQMGKIVSGDEVTLCDGKDPDGNPFQISTRKR